MNEAKVRTSESDEIYVNSVPWEEGYFVPREEVKPEARLGMTFAPGMNQDV